MNSRAKLKFNELWVRDNNMLTLPLPNTQNKNALISYSQINQNKKFLKANFLTDKQNNELINNEGIKIYISINEISHIKRVNNPFFVYINHNSADQIRNYAFLTLFISFFYCYIFF